MNNIIEALPNQDYAFDGGTDKQTFKIIGLRKNYKTISEIPGYIGELTLTDNVFYIATGITSSSN